MRAHFATVGLFLVALHWGACGGGEEAPSMVSPEAASLAEGSRTRRPVVEDVRLFPDSPLPGDRVAANVESSDPDGDSLEILYQWRVNGERVEASEPFYHIANLRKGSVVEVTAVARDGKAQSAPARAMVRVGNTLPVLHGVVIEPLGEVTANRDVTAIPRAVDQDGDAVSFEYSWRVNGRPAGNDSPVLRAQHFRRGDEIELTVIASDPEGSSGPLRSDRIPVANAAPRIVSVPGVFDDDGVFRYALRIEDPDGDRMFRYGLEEAPEGMTVDNVRGHLFWEPRENQTGVHAVVVTVDDRSGGVAKQRFEVQIDVEPVVPASAAR